MSLNSMFFLLLVSFSAHSFLVLARSSAATSPPPGLVVQLQIRKFLLHAVFLRLPVEFLESVPSLVLTRLEHPRCTLYGERENEKTLIRVPCELPFSRER